MDTGGIRKDRNPLGVETLLVPAKAARQRHDGVRRDGMDSFLNEAGQGLGLGLGDSLGDIAMVQEPCNEKTTWLLASAINRRRS